VALRMLPVASGTDHTGSLRNPGAFNHVFALRPAYGRVPAEAPDMDPYQNFPMSAALLTTTTVASSPPSCKMRSMPARAATAVHRVRNRAGR